MFSSWFSIIAAFQQCSCLTLHQPFQIWMFLIISLIHKLESCQCKESKFDYEPHSHIITEDVRVIETAKLREPVPKRPKYGEPNRISGKTTETICFNPLNSMQNILVQERTSISQIYVWFQRPFKGINCRAYFKFDRAFSITFTLFGLGGLLNISKMIQPIFTKLYDF